MKTIFLRAMLATAALTLSTAATAEVRDAAGQIVARAKTSPQRIVVGSGPLLHAVMAIESEAPGGQRGTDRIVAVGGDFASRDKATREALLGPHPRLAQVPATAFGDIPGLAPDAVLALKPDLAILSGTAAQAKPGSLAEVLGKAGVRVIFTDFRSHPGQNGTASLRAIAAALGHDPDRNRFVRFAAKQMARVTDVTRKLPATQRPSAFIDMRADPAKPCCGTAGKGNYGELIEAAGATNVGAAIHDQPLGRADPDKIVAADPRFYLAGSSGGGGVPLGRGVTADTARASLSTLVSTRAPLTTLPALREHRAMAVWHSFYNHPFHAAVVQAMAKRFHPGRFGTLAPEQTLADFYGFLGIAPAGTYWVSLPD